MQDFSEKIQFKSGVQGYLPLHTAAVCRKSNKMKKVAQINTKVKVSSNFSKVAGSRGGAPRRPSAIVNKVYCEILFYFKRTEQGVRNAKAFRGGATTNAPPFNRPKQTSPPKRSGGTFWTKQLLRAFCTACTGSISFLTD